MTDEKKSLFREKSVAQIQSPESLNEYMHVTSPGIWILMAAILVLMAGVIIWAIFGRIDSTAQVALAKDEEQVYCLVPEDVLESVIENPYVTVDGETLEMKPDVLEPQVVSSDMNVYLIMAGDLTVGDIVYPIEVEGTIENDVATGTVVTESISPISFLFN